MYKIEYTIAEDNYTVIVLYLVNTGVYLSSVVHYLNNAFTWDRWVVTRVCIVGRALWTLILEVTVYHRCQHVRGEKLVLVDLIRFSITLFQFNIKLDKQKLKHNHCITLSITFANYEKIIATHVFEYFLGC